MKHASCRELYEYWNRLRGDDLAPRRGEVEPGLLKSILGDTFILEAGEEDNYRYRLAGTRICSAYCRELKGRDFLETFSAADRGRLAPMLASLATRAAPLSIALTGWTERGFRLDFEAVLLPLRHSGQRYDRILGVFAPVENPYWLGTLPIVGQELTSLRLIADRRAAGTRPQFRPLPTLPPPRSGGGRPSLVVLNGGKA